MAFDHRRTVTHRLIQAARAYRVRAGARLSRIGLHSGQEALLKALANGDGRQARVFLTERGHHAIAMIDKIWKRVEKTALAGINDKDRRRLRKLLRQIERNLDAVGGASDADDIGQLETG